MPEYCYRCPECGQVEIVVRSMNDPEVVPECECDELDGLTPMVRNYTAEHPGVLGTEKGETFWSESLAINPEQTAEHRRLFPDVKVDPVGRLGFDSVKQRSDYCEATGFEKKSQRKEII